MSSATDALETPWLPKPSQRQLSSSTSAPHGGRRDAVQGAHPSPFVRKEVNDTDERQPMAIWDSINQVYSEGGDSTAGCSGWENRLAYRASCRSASECREDCLCKP